jgi:hypothetical protein
MYSGNVELTINDAFQYGQKNAAGEKRFVVYHNKENKPYQVCSLLISSLTCPAERYFVQHRFIETSLASVGNKVVQQMAAALGYSQIAGGVGDLVKMFAGDYLKTF